MPTGPSKGKYAMSNSCFTYARYWIGIFTLLLSFVFFPINGPAHAKHQQADGYGFVLECLEGRNGQILNIFVSTAFIEQVDDEADVSKTGRKDLEFCVDFDTDFNMTLLELKQMYENMTGIAIIPAPDPDPELQRRRVAHFLSFNAQAVIYGNQHSISQTGSNNIARITQYGCGNTALIKQWSR